MTLPPPSKAQLESENRLCLQKCLCGDPRVTLGSLSEVAGGVGWMGASVAHRGWGWLCCPGTGQVGASSALTIGTPSFQDSEVAAGALAPSGVAQRSCQGQRRRRNLVFGQQARWIRQGPWGHEPACAAHMHGACQAQRPGACSPAGRVEPRSSHPGRRVFPDSHQSTLGTCVRGYCVWWAPWEGPAESWGLSTEIGISQPARGVS